MNRTQSYAFVSQMFTQAFDKQHFLVFSRNLLNHMDEQKAHSWNNTYVKDAFKNHIQHYERLGTYISPSKETVDVLIVHLTTESKLERARTALRNFVADHLKTRSEKDAALVAFISPSESTWRLSYVKMEYATVEKDSGKVAVETRLTPARRFSYIVGKNESCHTAQTRFLDLLQDTQTDPLLKDIEEAFSVEAVTKEFFKKYVELFEEINNALEKLVAKDNPLRDEFANKGINTVDFVKKLMGQIVFLYFLQKKGWLGVEKGQSWGSGPHNFLRRLANSEYGKYANFFNDILTPLFYDTLATDRGHEAWCDHFKCRIPFLNGGLFEPPANYDWRKINVVLPNRLFTNNEYVEESITGTGLFDVFDRYNFTVNEAEPLEKEVAIDPEMLGKVFENLIEDNRRKGLGAYYTPREIVHYMCQESLINYLDTALNSTDSQNLVPRPDIETLVHLGEQISHYEYVETNYPIKMPQSIQKHARLIDEKLADITVCDPAVGSGAFPVGMMTEIVRARSALTPYFNDINERTPYHFKRNAIQNSLYGVDIDASAVEIAKLRLWLSLVVDEEDVMQIKPLPNLDYKIVTGNSLHGVKKNLFNINLFNRLEELKPLYFNESEKIIKEIYKRDIDSLIYQLTNDNKSFDFDIFFSEVFHRKGGFDVVLGNPPYVTIGGKEDMGITKSEKDYYIKNYTCTDYKPNYFVFFYEKGYQLISRSGFLIYIVPRTLIDNVYLGNIRMFLKNKTRIRLVIKVNSEVFESGITGGSSICGVSKDLPIGNVKVAVLDSTKAINNLLWRIIDQEEIIFGEYNAFVFESPEIMCLFTKIKSKGIPLGIYCSVNNGVNTGNAAKFLLSEQSKSMTYRKLLEGKDIHRYFITWGGNWINYDSNLKKKIKLEDLETRQTKIDFALRDSRIFDSPKIVIRQTSDKLIGCLDEAKFVTRHSTHCIVVERASISLKYILAVFNSNLMNFYYKTLIPETGKVFAEVKAIHVKQFPIYPATNDQQAQIESFVNLIMKAKSLNPATDTKLLEKEINKLVYHFYGLTEEEIILVEEEAKR